MPAQDAIDEAWGRLPPAGRTVETAGRYTSARMERIIQIVIAVGALVVGGQAFVASWEVYHAGVAHGVLHAVMFVAVVAMALLCVVGRGVRVAAATLAIVYPVALLAWPAVMGAVPPDPQTQPWIFYLVNFATLAAMLAFPLAWQYVWAVSMSVLYAAVRLAWGGFEAPYWVGIGYDVSFALIQGGVFVTVGWVLRSLAGGVDEARSQAVAAYARATSADAGEQERVAVAALMHDSVLAALIAAERAQSPRQRQLAVSMAREALTRLANAESDDREGSDEPVSRAWIAGAVERSAAELGVPVVVSRADGGDDDAEVVPGRVARAVVLAATQAVANAVQHADAAGLAVSVSREGEGVRVEVSDTGPGVDVAAIPADRLGIRASIFARMAAAGGEARIASGARGTRVALTWTGENPV
ncbi:sensor histidine kinase [Microbacterium marinilacus]|uniref:Histidine kinase/HSP90-like ATPase domain-containing protein n=1 Tax=Microbacterium marinilacus TaxID=415209 RepID=A0ABP7BAW0_9MICO|nr:ATP-binding protein [Microbacterium marinilacus]